MVKKNLVNNSTIDFEELFYYDETSPSCLRSNCDRINRRTLHTYIKKGDVVGGLNGRGYWQVSVDKKLYKAHHIVWYLHNGREMDGVIDHVDRNPSNNKISNLRLVTQNINLMNGKTPVWAKIPLKGITFRSERGRNPRFVVTWIEESKRMTKSFSVNCFDNLLQVYEEAVEFRKNTMEKLGIIPRSTIDCEYNAAREFAGKLGPILYSHFPECMKALNYGETLS